VTLLEALGGHPYARFALGMAAEPEGVLRGDTVIRRGETPFGRIAHAFGPPAPLPPLDDVLRLNIPAAWPVPGGWEERERWDFRWTTTAPAASAHALSEVDAPEEVGRLLDAAHPDTLRPGHPLIRRS
jgi:hypothetical protein